MVTVMRKYVKGISGKIVAPFVVLIVLAITIISIFPIRYAKRALEDQLTKKAEILVKNLAAAVSADSLSGGEADRLNEILRKGRDVDVDVVYACLIDIQGNVLAQGGERSQFKDEEKLFEMMHPVIVMGEKIGTLRIGMTKERIHRVTNNIQKAIIAVGFLVLLIGVVVYLLLVDTAIRKPLDKVMVVVKDIAQDDADLTRRLDIDTKDEMGEMGLWFNKFMDRLHDIIHQVKGNSEYVASASGEINSTSAQLASGAEEQSRQASEVATSVQEMAATILQNSQNAGQTAKIAEMASAKAQEGSEAMQATHQGMEEIVASSAKTGEVVISLSNRADQIGEIIQVIDDIADQTNLLALNAAIEAARAGEQGRGFAVVADEVRKLAERTTKATKEIADTINAIQNETRQVADSMKDAGVTVNKGKEAALKAESVLDEIIQSVTQSMERVNEIAKATEEMSSSAEHISKNMDTISTVSRQSASGVGQMAGISEHLSKQTEALMNLINQFKLNESASRAVPKAVHKEGLSDVFVGETGAVETRVVI